MKSEKNRKHFIGLLIKLLTHQEDHEQYIGDIEEMYLVRLKQEGKLKANFFLWSQILRSIPSYILTSIFWGAAMFKNYFKIAWRNLINYRIYSFINLSGIAISIAACFLILQYVGFEQSYDAFNKNADDLYRITNDRYQDNKLIQHGVITYPSVARQMQTDYPEVKNFTRIVKYNEYYVKHGENRFTEDVLYADSAFFEMFSYPLIVGDVKTVLAAPYSLAMSESQAEKYYGKNWKKENVLGKTIILDNSINATLTGVFRDIPVNSHMEFNMVMSWSTLTTRFGKQMDDSWTNSNFMCYVQLQPGVDAKALEKKLELFSKNYFEGNEVTGYYEKFFLQPVKDIHLYSDYEYETWVHGNGTAVTALLIIAGFILIIAWVNSVNLSTARSMERAKEVGLRKVVGAQRTNIIKQFLLESLLFNLAGIGIAAIIVKLLEPVFSELLSVKFSADVMTSNLGLLFVVLFTTGTLVSGLYPAMITSSFKITSVLKGKITRVGYGRVIRKGLVVFQFALSFVLITGTYAVYKQINFMMHKDLGMNIEQMLVVNGPYLSGFDSTFIEKSNSFKAELKRYPSITAAATARRLPGRRTGRIFNVQNTSGESDEKFTTSDIGVDFDYFKTFNMKILAGRGFERADHKVNLSETDKTVINSTAANLLGFTDPENAVGKHLNFWGRVWTIVGVVADHHQQSVHVPVEPIIFTPQYSTGSWFFVKVNPQNVNETIALIEDKYNQFFPDNSFKYYFLDEYFNTQYQADQNFGKSFGIFTMLGVLLASLGLFGLAFFTVAQRRKEIGIRKVSGATTNNILMLFLKDFTILVLIAVILASPLSYYAINEWLLGYAYRIDFGMLMLVLPAFAILFVALLTVSYQTIKAALMNPIDPLKTD